MAIGKYTGKTTGGTPKELEGQKNGRLPLSKLRRCVTQAQLETEAAFLYAPAAREFDRMVRAAARDGVELKLVVGYRDYEEQVRQKTIWTARGIPGNAATPGRSNHGWGTAVDINRHLPGVLDWMKAHARKWGFDWPTWAAVVSKTTQQPREPWHWEYILSHVPEDEVRVKVDRVEIPAADGFIQDGRVWVALRPVVTAAKGKIDGFRKGATGNPEAHLDGDRVGGWIEYLNLEGTGYAMAKDIAAILGKTANYEDGVLSIF